MEGECVGGRERGGERVCVCVSEGVCMCVCFTFLCLYVYCTLHSMSSHCLKINWIKLN